MNLSWIIKIITNPQWASAIVTFLAVLVALFGQTFWDWKNRPKIKLGLWLDVPHVVTDYSHLRIISKLYRLRAKNNGKTVARSCKVKIISVTPENEENKNEIKEMDILKWSSAPRDMNYSHGSANRDSQGNISWIPIYREEKDLSPLGGSEFFDLLTTDTSTNGLEISFASSGIRKFAMDPSKKYIILIEFSGDNFKPKRAKIKLSKIQGPWLADKNQNWLNLEWVTL